MNDPHSAIPEHAKPALWRRYEDWRVRRYEAKRVKYAGRFPGMRNRRAYRRLVVALSISQIVFMASAVVSFFTAVWFFIPFAVGLGGSLWVLVTLRIVTGSVADAPIGALDEIQLAQRNSARSIGYIVIFCLAFVPYALLIFMGSAMEYVRGQNVYGIGVVLISLVYIGACTPTMLTAWWMSDPDPEDFEPDPDDNAVGSAEPEVAQADQTAPPVQSRTPVGDLDPPAPAPW